MEKSIALQFKQKSIDYFLGSEYVIHFHITNRQILHEGYEECPKTQGSEFAGKRCKS